MNYLGDLVGYVRGLLGAPRARPHPHPRCLYPHASHASPGGKRRRSEREEDFGAQLQRDSSDEDEPSFKRHRRRTPPPFPLVMSHSEKQDKHVNASTSKVRYVPIQVEGDYPNTSTPHDSTGRRTNRNRTTPGQAIGSSQIKRFQSPTSKIIHIDDDPDVSWIEPKSHNYNSKSQASPKLYIKLDDDEEHDENDGDIVFFDRVDPSPAHNKQNVFVSRTSERTSSPRQYYRIHRKFPVRQSESPKPYTKFKTPAGIMKSYRKKNATDVPNWLYPLKTSSNNRIPMRSRLTQMSDNMKTAIEEAFNIKEKLQYQALIQNSIGNRKPCVIPKATETINLVDDSVAEKGDNCKGDSDNDYGPITVASLTSSDSEVEIVSGSETSKGSSLRASPVNTFKDRLKAYPVTSVDYLKNLDQKHQEIKAKTQQKLHDVKKVSELLGQQNRRQTVALLERSFKNDLTLEGDILVEAEVTELPKLTPEQEKLVKRALGTGPSGQLLIEKFNLRIHRRDLQTLAGLNWLNDEVINFYMNLLMQRSEERSDLPKVYAANTFFYPKLMQTGQPGLKRWTRKVDIFAHDLIVIPVHLGVHWCLCLVEMDLKRVSYLDSMGGRNVQCLDAVLQYLCDEHKDKKGEPFDDKGWKKECLKDIPQQMNGSDCGMFACTFAEFASRRSPFTFTQKDMPYLRRKVACEILLGKLML